MSYNGWLPAIFTVPFVSESNPRLCVYNAGSYPYTLFMHTQPPALQQRYS